MARDCRCCCCRSGWDWSRRLFHWSTEPADKVPIGRTGYCDYISVEPRNEFPHEGVSKSSSYYNLDR